MRPLSAIKLLCRRRGSCFSFLGMHWVLAQDLSMCSVAISFHFVGRRFWLICELFRPSSSATCSAKQSTWWQRQQKHMYAIVSAGVFSDKVNNKLGRNNDCGHLSSDIRLGDDGSSTSWEGAPGTRHFFRRNNHAWSMIRRDDTSTSCVFRTVLRISKWERNIVISAT